MTARRAPLLLAVAALCASCAAAGTGNDPVSQAALAPLPTVGGVGILPAAVPPERKPLVVATRPVNDDGTTSELIGEATEGNRILMIGDSILASTATRYSGYMCDVLVPLGWAVSVEAEPSRSIDFGNRVLDKLLPAEPTDPAGEVDDWDAAAVFLGSNYGSDQERYESELRVILTRLAPRPTLLYTVTEYRPAWAEVNETVRKLAGEFPNVTVIDWQAISTIDGVLSGDRLHPSDQGRRVLVDVTAAALGPAAVGSGECIESSFRNDSAAGRGGASTPASRPSGSSTATTTVKPATGSTTTAAPGAGGGSTTVPASTVPASTVPATTAPATTAPATTVAATTTTVATTTTSVAAPPVIPP